MFLKQFVLFLHVFLFSRLCAATPVETHISAGISKVSGVDVSKLSIPSFVAAEPSASKFEGTAILGLNPSTSTPNTGFHALSPALADSFVYCPADLCDSTYDPCYAYTLSSFVANTCYQTSYWYSSFYIYQASNTGLSYGVYVGTSACQLPVLIPGVNTCYHIINSDGSLRNVLQTVYIN